MQNMIPITINLASVPEAERRALCTDAIRRAVPFEVVVAEAMIEKAQREMSATGQEKAKTAA